MRYLAPVALRKLQDGTRGTVVVYHLTADLDARVKEAAEGWTVYNETFAPGKNAYYTPTDLSALPSPLVLVGFSEGCQGVRANLLKRILPAACIAVDGIHAALDVGNNVPVWTQQIEPWLEYGKECAMSEVIPPPLFFVTHSAIQTTGYLSTTQTLPHYLPDIANYETAPGDDGSTVSYPNFRVGQTKDYVPIMVWAYPGKDAAAHVFQATNVLPARLRDMCNPGKVLSLPPVKAPPSGGGGGGVKPVTPSPPVTPAPPGPGPVKPVASKSDNGQGLVGMLAAAIGIGAVVVSKSKKLAPSHLDSVLPSCEDWTSGLSPERTHHVTGKPRRTPASAFGPHQRRREERDGARVACRRVCRRCGALQRSPRVPQEERQGDAQGSRSRRRRRCRRRARHHGFLGHGSRRLLRPHAERGRGSRRGHHRQQGCGIRQSRDGHQGRRALSARRRSVGYVRVPWFQHRGDDSGTAPARFSPASPQATQVSPVV